MRLSTEEIERAIDDDGAWNLLLAIEMVLDEKADHIRTNWQDKKSAAVYRRFAKRCGTLARELEKSNV